MHSLGDKPFVSDMTVCRTLETVSCNSTLSSRLLTFGLFRRYYRERRLLWAEISHPATLLLLLRSGMNKLSSANDFLREQTEKAKREKYRRAFDSGGGGLMKTFASRLKRTTLAKRRGGEESLQKEMLSELTREQKARMEEKTACEEMMEDFAQQLRAIETKLDQGGNCQNLSSSGV
jgi:hypothetical protein